jgi:hypothetical protein
LGAQALNCPSFNQPGLTFKLSLRAVFFDPRCIERLFSDLCEEDFLAQKVKLLNPSTGLMKQGFYGFSWTYLFFGWFVPLFRGELGVAALHLMFTIFTFGFWQIIVAFLYNKQYMTRMIEKGYRLNDEEHVMDAARMKLDMVKV